MATDSKVSSSGSLTAGRLLLGLFSGLVLFFCMYRVALLRPSFVLNLVVGAIGLLLLFHTSIGRLLWTKPKWRRLALCAAALGLYALTIDSYGISSGLSVRSAFSMRMAMLAVMSFCCALAIVVLMLKGSLYRLRLALLVCILIQLAFFVVLFVSPELKFPVYSIFGMQDSPNLYEWNVETRGFGVGAELNFTAPIVTAIIVILLFRSAIFKAVIIVAQIANTTIAIFSLVFFVRHLFFAALVLGGLYLLYVNIPGLALMVQEFLPRFSNELLSGFSITAREMLSGHLIYDGRTTVDLLFGTGLNLLPEAGRERSSDMGWVIMLNYGGLVLIALSIAFFHAAVSVTPFNLVTKILLFCCALGLNTKGLVLGPNAFFFFLFLLALNSLSIPGDESRVASTAS